MNNKEEILEEINVEEKNEITPDKKIDEELNELSLSDDTKEKKEDISKATNEVENKETEEKNSEDEGESSEGVDEITEEEYYETSSKKKTLMLVILSILLLIDLAFLIIYIIGIDKVLSFVK